VNLISLSMCFAFLKVNDVENFLLMPCFLNVVSVTSYPFSISICKHAKFSVSASFVINVSISICKPVKF
jgi:hypothetical protein